MATRALLLGAAAAAAAATLTPTLVAAGPCADPDLRCWNMEAVRLVNEMRSRLAGLPPLAVGTVSALDNAVAHSRYLVRGPFQHQADGAATRAVGCNAFVSGENIAKGYPHRDNPAATCVKQWEHSKGHRDNILSTYHKETVVGIVSTAEGYWCTQTFQVKGEGRTGARCQSAARTGPPTHVVAPPHVPQKPAARPPPPQHAPPSRPPPPSRLPPPHAPTAPRPARPARGGGGGGGKPARGNKPKGGRGGRKKKGCRGGKNKGGRRGPMRGGQRGGRRGGRRGNHKGGRGGRRGNHKGGRGGRRGNHRGGRGGRRGNHKGGRNGGGRHGGRAPWAHTRRTCKVGHRRGGRIVWKTVPCAHLRGGQSPRRQ